ncbi:MAG TPA: secretin N-terminal domain-containing protein [Gemmatimonadaceae bacterium]|nr:secretin N-terminal domain-containing protein [Gemmatimonadaceae bacterium]
MKKTFLVALLTLTCSVPVWAQGGGRGQPPRRDSTATRKTPEGDVLDFKDADISVVLNAIAEAGNLNININQPPSVRVSLRVSAQMTKETATEMLKVVAEGNGFTVTETPSIIRLVGPPKAPPPQQQTQQQTLSAAQLAAMRVRELHTVRLKHATASTVAPILMSLLRGTGGVGGVGGRGGINPVTGIQQGINAGRGGNAGVGGAGAAGGAGGGGGGGRGGRGGGANNPVAIQGGGNIFGGAGGNPGIQALANLFGGGGGGITTTASLAFSDINIVADDGTNSLMILSTAEDFQAIQPLLQSIDLRPLQVLIEVTIAQVERSKDLNMGISAVTTKNGKKTTSTSTTTTNAQGVKSTTSTATTTGKVDTTGIFPSAASARDFIAQLVGGKGAINYAVAINALQSIGDVRVLSTPVLIAQNNKQAVLNVGARVPFVQVSQTVVNDPTGRVQTVQYQDVGTTLTITPTINSDGYVNLAVQQTSDNLTNNVQFDAQIINTRQAQTQIFVKDGQTTVVGGLTDNTTSNSKAGIPILSKIPFIGGLLFGNTQNSKVTTELYLFLTPHIVSSDEDIDRLRESVRGTSDVLKGLQLQKINPGGDTVRVGVPKDSVKKKGGEPPNGPKSDSLNVRPDSLPLPQPAPASRELSLVRVAPWRPAQEYVFG